MLHKNGLDGIIYNAYDKRCRACVNNIHNAPKNATTAAAVGTQTVSPAYEKRMNVFIYVNWYARVSQSEWKI